MKRNFGSEGGKGILQMICRTSARSCEWTNLLTYRWGDGNCIRTKTTTSTVHDMRHVSDQRRRCTSVTARRETKRSKKSVRLRRTRDIVHLLKKRTVSVSMAYSIKGKYNLTCKESILLPLMKKHPILFWWKTTPPRQPPLLPLFPLPYPPFPHSLFHYFTSPPSSPLLFCFPSPPFISLPPSFPLSHTLLPPLL